MKKILYLLFCAMALWVFSAHAATVLWNEATNGTLTSYPYAPTNGTYVIHPIGTATDDVNYVIGSVSLVPNGGNFYSYDDSFSFIVPQNRRFTGLVLTESANYPAFAFGGLCDSATGIYDGTGDLGT